MAFSDINEQAFTCLLNQREYPGYVKNEMVIEKWYRLSFEEARRFIGSLKKIIL
ncbi:hypothetical protein MHK_001766 [Candidatus Magnetomorum sp. HK-1]|nr:hypothetical protein MHK_001766 [Candidatus Magnetomorum sp. HK-1]